MSFILFLTATILAIILLPIGMIYSLFRLKFHLKQYFLIIAIAIDQLGNVVMQDLFDDLMIKKEGHKFGNEDETISSVLGKNKRRGTRRR